MYSFAAGLQVDHPSKIHMVTVIIFSEVSRIPKGTHIPEVCKIIAFMASILGLGLLFYILLGLRYF